jgi:hypothetical protein
MKLKFLHFYVARLVRYSSLYFLSWFPWECYWTKGVLEFKLKSPLYTMTWLRNVCVINDHGYVPFVVITIWFFPHSWLITWFLTRVRRRVPLVEQELLTLSEHLNSPPVFSGVRGHSFVFSVVFCKSFSFCTFSLGYCIVCPSLIDGFWLSFLVSSNCSIIM